MSHAVGWGFESLRVYGAGHLVTKTGGTWWPVLQTHSLRGVEGDTGSPLCVRAFQQQATCCPWQRVALGPLELLEKLT